MLEQKLQEIKTKEEEYVEFKINLALEKDYSQDALISIIRAYSQQIIKVKQKLEIINSCVSEQYYK